MTGPSDIAGDLRVDIDRSCRYHARRRAFFDTFHKVIAGAIILSGSSAVVGIFRESTWFSAIAAALTAVLSTCDLVVGLSHRARDHEMLYRRFMELAAEMATVTSPDEKIYSIWEQKRLKIEIDEPPIYRALDVSCHNEVIQARGLNPLDKAPLSRWQRIMKEWFRFSGHEFPSMRELGGGQRRSEE